MRHFLSSLFKLKYVLIAFTIGFATVSCNPPQVSEEEQVQLAVDILKEHFERVDPTLKEKEYKVSISVFPRLAGEVSSCACFQVCDGNGQNCTKCECDPKGCAKC